MKLGGWRGEEGGLVGTEGRRERRGGASVTCCGGPMAVQVEVEVEATVKGLLGRWQVGGWGASGSCPPSTVDGADF